MRSHRLPAIRSRKLDGIDGNRRRQRRLSAAPSGKTAPGQGFETLNLCRFDFTAHLVSEGGREERLIGFLGDKRTRIGQEKLAVSLEQAIAKQGMRLTHGRRKPGYHGNSVGNADADVVALKGVSIHVALQEKAAQKIVRSQIF